MAIKEHVRRLRGLLFKFFRFLGFDVRRTGAASLRCARLEWLDDAKIKTIIDVGANEGQFAQLARRRFPNAKIYSFEPVRKSFDLLTANMAGDRLFKAFHAALGSREGEVQMFANRFSPSSSLLPMLERHVSEFPETGMTDEETVPLRRLDVALKGETVEPEILLKIDVQGYELEVLKGATSLLAQISVAILETSFLPLYKGQPLFQDIYSTMLAAGFTYSGNLDQIYSPRDGRILQADAVFVRIASSSA